MYMRKRYACFLIVFLLGLGGNGALSVFKGIPAPVAHDEFSYLLAADTFTHGRITNPPHLLWPFFETFYVLQQPTYMSKYPPAQGLFLAVGQRLGHPIYGVWLSAALMSVAIAWMLHAWLPPRWALIGALAATMQFGIFSYWSQSYWGGCVAALGGALVFGALPRLLKTQRWQDLLWLAVGIALLANSRPLEGFLVALPMGLLVLSWKSRKVMSVTIFLGLILVIIVAGMAIYNKQITGEAKIPPYLLYAQTYRNVPLFIWQPYDSTVKLDHPEMIAFEKNNTEKMYRDKRTPEGFVKAMQKDLAEVAGFFLGFPLALPAWVLLAAYFFNRRTAWRFWVSFFIFLIALAVTTTSAKAHYFAPLTCLAALVIARGLRALSLLKMQGRRLGMPVVIFLLALQLSLDVAMAPTQDVNWSASRAVESPIRLPPTFNREQLSHILTQQGGKYLVLVSYRLPGTYFYEWVNNAADIDHAPIVWAHDMGARENQKILAYFKGRRVIYINVYWDKLGAEES